MSSIQPYLSFDGNCEEALNFYVKVFSGEKQNQMTWEESPMKNDVPDNWKKKIMHSNFKIRGDQLMASDTFPGKPVTKGDNVTLSVNFNKDEKIDNLFNELAAGGKIGMPLQKTFWGAYFGLLTDKFGINWMFNQHLEEQK
jgi:PhnB protein